MDHLDRPRLHVPTVVLTVLVTATVLNVVEFAGIDGEVSEWYDAVDVKPGHDLRALTEDHFSVTADRFLLHTRLRDLAPGAVMVLPPGVRWSDEGLIGLAGTGAVERVGTPLTADAAAAAALDAAAVATGVDRVRGPYSIVVDPEDPPARLLAVVGPDRLYVVDEALAAELGIGS